MSAAGALFTYLAWCLTPALFFGLVAAVLSPEENRVKRLRGWAVDRLGEVRRHGEAPAQPDPFAVLAVQVRLERLAGEIAYLETRPVTSARGHHLRVAVTAYDDVLADACRMAGVPDDAAEPAPVRRIRREAELRSRGWTW